MSLTCVLPESAPCTTGSVTDGFFVIFTPADWVLVVLEILSGPQPSVQASLVAELGVHCPRQVQADDDQEDHLSWMLETPPSSGLVSGETRSTLSGRDESTASSMMKQLVNINIK